MSVLGMRTDIRMLNCPYGYWVVGIVQLVGLLLSQLMVNNRAVDKQIISRFGLPPPLPLPFITGMGEVVGGGRRQSRLTVAAGAEAHCLVPGTTDERR